MEQFYLLRKQDKIYIFLHRSNSNEILLSKKKLLKTKNSYIKKSNICTEGVCVRQIE